MRSLLSNVGRGLGAVLIALPALAQEAKLRAVAVGNAGFEVSAAAGLPAEWTLAGALPAGATAARVEGGHAGAAALELAAGRPASLAAHSAPVALKVGRFYRLSAWVQTEDAAADPTSRYPTAVAATVAMQSFPFTNHSPAVAGTRGWTRVETTFVATTASDRVVLLLGRNGTATGRARFDDVALEEIADVTDVIPLERVRWAGPAFRYEDRGWIYVHVEGAPYARGRQFGTLVADEIVAYARKLAIRQDEKNPADGWASLRTLADALMLRRFDPELLEEMKGIADGAAAAGAKLFERKVDLLDVATLNAAVDLDQMTSALPVTPTAITGRTFSPHDELEIPDRLHKCSSLSATGPATRSGKPVFFQMFMWDGYTGLHFNVILDVAPEKGRRFVMQTFPGGIHSGTDFYMNDAGLLVGETTVLQTPFDVEGEPQSSRIRRAVQYGTSIDEVAAILRERNNGMYTNDWTMADVKTGEAAILLLGTKHSKLWRSGDAQPPFGTPGFLWANNNARDAAVRREVANQPEDAPFDSTFGAANRDVAFQQFYREHKGAIDVKSVVGLMASSPINRPHALDGKVTDAEMAAQLVFMAHQGKTTQREKFPAPGNRRMPDLPGVTPHLTHGYATFSPIVVAEGLKAARARAGAPAKPAAERVDETKAVADRFDFKREELWAGSIFPASDADNWLIAGDAAYWRILRALPEKAAERPEELSRALAGLRGRLLTIVAHEGDLAATRGGVAFDRYGPAQIPRFKGAFALHQLRLQVGSKAFFALMRDFHAQHRNREVTGAQFLEATSAAFKRDVAADLRPWLEGTGLPDPQPAVTVAQAGKAWKVTLRVSQPAPAWRLASSVAIETAKTRHLFPVRLEGPQASATFTVPEKPTRVVFDPLADVPVATERARSFAAFADDFSNSRIVYGTGGQVEANHTLALRFQSVVADGFSEVLPPVVQDAAMDDAALAAHDLFVLGDPRDNALLARLLPQLPLEAGPGWFRFRGKTYGGDHDGLYLALPNPFAPKRTLHVFLSNTAQQLHEMTKTYRPGLPAWAIFEGDKVEAEGHFPIARFELPVK
jgi:hypothetical protein